MYTRFYVRTGLIQVNGEGSGHMVNISAGGEVYIAWSRVVISREELEAETIKAAKNLDLNSRRGILYQTLDDAKEVIDTKSSRPGEDGFNFYYAPAVVEIVFDLSKLEREEKYKPENYFMTRAWIKEHPVELQKDPKSYKTIFNATEGNVINKVSALFRDYHSPSLFSFHWRHHKKLAESITTQLNSKNIHDAFGYLFQQRQELIESNTVDLEGSFMRRMEAGLRLLIKNGAVPSNSHEKSEVKQLIAP